MISVRLDMDEPSLRRWCQWKRFTDAAGHRRGVGWLLKQHRAGASLRAAYTHTEGHCQHWRLELAG